MVFKAKGLGFSGMAGVILACLIFVAAVMVFPSQPSIPNGGPSDGSTGFPGGSSPYDGYITVDLSVSDFEPSELGGEAELTVTVTFRMHDSFNITIAYIGLSEGIRFVGGSLTWSGFLKEDVPESFSARIKAVKVGNWTIKAEANCYYSLDSRTIRYWETDWEDISVAEDEVVVKSHLGRSNPTLPMKMWTSISEFTEPQGVGSEANLTIHMTAWEDIPEVHVGVWLGDWPWVEGEVINFVTGNTSSNAWHGSIKAYETKSFTVRIKALKVGWSGIELVIGWLSSDSKTNMVRQYHWDIEVHENEIIAIPR